MSDIRKIQAGNNQYTLHARVSDKLAVSSQIGSTTKPVYVDSSGDVQACSREIPNIPYSVTKINSCLVGDFCYDAINSYIGPEDYCMPRIFSLEPGDKIIVHATGNYDLTICFIDINHIFDDSIYLKFRVNTPVTINDHVECVLRGWYHLDLPAGYVEIYRNNSTTTDTLRLISEDISYLLGVEQADSLYVKKTDGQFRYKGSVDSLSNLISPDNLTIENAGDVYKIRTASTNNSITTNPGDCVVFVWDETKNTGHWENLSGTVDLSAYSTTATTDAISADVKKLMDKAFPFTVKVSIDKILAKKGTSQPVKVTITPKIGDDNTTVDTILINGAEHHDATPYVYSATATTTTTYNVRANKDGRTAQGSATITFVNPSYDGVVAANFTATEANIKALTEALRSGKGGTRTFNLNNQKACIAYPKAFGAATSIKDANGFDYLDSYTRSELNVNGELYYVYLLTNATTITDIKQTIS